MSRFFGARFWSAGFWLSRFWHGQTDTPEPTNPPKEGWFPHRDQSRVFHATTSRVWVVQRKKR